MDRLTLPSQAKRFSMRLLPFLLCIGAAGCGGHWEVGFGGEFGHDHRNWPDKPDRPREPLRETGLFLIAGDLCRECTASVDGRGSAAKFNGPEGVAADNAGNVYVAERGSSTIRKVTEQGVVTTLAGSAGATGSADGVGAAARFNNPTRLVVDADGNLYVTDTANSTVRRITPAGVVTTLAGAAGACGRADGTATGAQFCNPQGITLDGQGNLYVADTLNHTIRRIDLADRVTTIAGTAGVCGSADGQGAAAQFCEPRDIAVDSRGTLYVADTANSTIRAISPSGAVTTLAGRAGVCAIADGDAAVARFCQPRALTVDWSGDVYVADTGNSTVRRIARDGRVSTVAGIPGQNGTVLGPLPGGLDSPAGVTITDTGALVLTSHKLVLKLVPSP